MSTFKTKIKVAAPNDIDLSYPIELEAYVDGGSTYTQIPRLILKQLAIKPRKSKKKLKLANGTFIEREIGGAQVWVQGEITNVDVIFGEDGDEILLGATALEQTGFYVDHKEGKLVARDSILLL